MINYKYKCKNEECKHEEEIKQRISEDKIIVCTVATVKDISYYNKEETKQESSKKGRKDKENYYSEEGSVNGIFYGKGAEKLNLLGEFVEVGDLQSLVNGQNPKTKEQIFKFRKAKVHLIDTCLSAPKDFSLLAEFDKENKDKYVEIFDRACKRAMDVMQEKAYRRLNSKNKKAEDVLLIQAYFDHKTSRSVDEKEPDPQWHRHVLTFKKCIDTDENVRTIDPFFLFNWQKLYGAVFRAELANGLRELGFSVDKSLTQQENKKNKYFGFTVVGITEAQRISFSNRKSQIDYVAKIGATAIDKYNVAQAIKRAKTIWNKQELDEKWNEKSLANGINQSFINSLKTFNHLHKVNYAKLDESLINSVLYSNRTFTEKDLQIRLAEYEQYTGANYKKMYKGLMNSKSIKHKNMFMYTANFSKRKEELLSNRFLKMLKLMFFKNLTLDCFSNATSLNSEFFKEMKQPEVIKGNELVNVDSSNAESLIHSIADIEKQMLKNGLTDEKKAQLKVMLDELYRKLYAIYNNIKSTPKFKHVNKITL